MIVRYWMSSKIISVSETSTLLDVVELLRSHRIRRVLVVRGDQLCGIISQSDLFQFINPSQFRKVALSSEVEALLRSRSVNDHMTRSPITCGPDDALEDVGQAMCSRGVRAMPVVRDGKLLGIITESDILRALTKIAGAGDSSRRICARIPATAKTQVCAQVLHLCEKHRLELVSLLSHATERADQHLVTVRVRGANVERFVDELWKTHFQVLQVV
ncbi:MAG: CBS domain-containing protein [Planctomycetota bacterium]